MTKLNTCGDCGQNKQISKMVFVKGEDGNPYIVCERCAAEHDEYEVCKKHGLVRVLEYGSSPGYCGRIYWAKLSCGCQDVDASNDYPDP